MGPMAKIMPFGQMMFKLQKLMPNFLECPKKQSEKKNL